MISKKHSVPSSHQKNDIALTLALLFHICGVIGILFTPYRQWFINSTPVNLLLMATLLVLTQRQKNFPFFFFLFLCYVTGLISEIVGVNTGWLFGHYQYGGVLGPKVLNVPLLIGINWFIILYCSGVVIFYLDEWLYKKLSTDLRPSLIVQLFTFVVDAALLTTLFDYILEPIAVQFDYWKWLPDGFVPLYNFVCWFIISVILQTVFRVLKFDKRNQFAVHLLIIQVLFFLILQTFL